MPADVNLMIENVIQNTNGIIIRINVSVKKTKYRVCEEHYAWNPSIYACVCNND